MKRISFIIFLAVTWLACGLARQLSNEDKQMIIARLDSTENGQDLKALSDIVRNDIVEAIPYIESKIWQRYTGDWDAYLDALLHFRSANLPTLLGQLIDSSGSYGTKPLEVRGTLIPPMWNPVRIRVEATYYLFQLGDHSTTKYVFEGLRQPYGSLAFNRAFSLLRNVVEQVPLYVDSVRAELIRIAQNAAHNEQRGRAQDAAVSLLGRSVVPEVVSWAKNDADPANRITALQALFLLDYKDLRLLLIERLSQEAFVSYKQDIAESLLVRYGSVDDYQIVMDYLLTETSVVNKLTVGRALREFKPPPPRPPVSAQAMLDTLVAYKHRVYALGWLADANFVKELDNGLENAKKHLAKGDSVNAYKEVQKFQDKVNKEYEKTVDNEKKGKPRDKRFVTVEGWKFLYYNAQYIMDRLPSGKKK